MLGWSNADKIRVLRQQLEQADTVCKTVVGQVADMDQAIRGLAKKQAVLHELTRFTDHADIDWPATAQRIEKCELDRQQLTSEAGELAILEQQITWVEKEINKLKQDTTDANMDVGKTVGNIGTAVLDLRHAFNTLQIAGEDSLQALFPQTNEVLEDFDTWLTLIDEQPIPDDRLTDAVRQTLLTFNEDTAVDRGRVRQLANDVPKKLDQMIGLKTTAENDLRSNLIRQMGEYRHEFPVESADFSNDMRDLDLYVARYNLLNDSELARHEARFRELLQRGTIHEVALFDTYLRQRETDIAEKIDLINEHLKQVSYSPTSYVQLTRDRLRGGSAEAIDDFRNELRACLADSVGEAAYSEAKYAQVKQLLDRLESTRDEDQRWTERVTDVRQWFTFGVSERDRETEQEREFYSDASGKSGGQKEKLAYTILASAIAYQFGLNENRPRTFRFVMIDEAFGRSSDESTRHGLDLFRQMNIQLLIVTPLQKINIIENYINAVHFVSNESGQNSQVRTIDKVEYEQEKARRDNESADD